MLAEEGRYLSWCNHWLIWLSVGYVAALLDQLLALGYGLVASTILVGIIGNDPRLCVPTILLSQVIFSTLYFRRVKISDINKDLVIFISLITLLTIVFPIMFSRLQTASMLILYNVAYLTILLMYLDVLVRGNSPSKLRIIYLVVLVVIVALDKVTIGGGLSMALVLAQRIMGIDAYNALLALPALKLLPTASALLGYVFGSYAPSIYCSLVMATGGIAGTYTARKFLKPGRVSERILLLALVLSYLVILLRTLSLLL